MRKQFKIYLLMIIAGMISFPGYAGNPDRVGQSGAVQLNINPWARTSGWGNANVGGIKGIEAMMQNVAGLSFSNQTEFVFSRTNWLTGSEVNVNAFGLSQRIGAEGSGNVLGITIMSLGFGDIPITTTDQPDGGLGTFSPQFMNIGVGYSREFSNAIRGGALVRVISESITNVKSQGLAIDAGIQYVTGENDRAKFGVSLRNIGSPMQYTGDGLASRARIEGRETSVTLHTPSAQFELPSTLQIGFTYDIFMGDSAARAVNMNMLTLAGTFLSNAFGNDQISVGAQYGFREMIMLRAGFVYEDGIFDANRINAFTGPSAGVSFELPFGTGSREPGAGDAGINRKIGLDYSIRTTMNFNHTHSFGARLSL